MSRLSIKLAATATLAVGLIATTPAAASADAVATNSEGDTQTFTGFQCFDTDYRYDRFRVLSMGPPELWMTYSEPGCDSAQGFLPPNGQEEVRLGVGSIRRYR
jgi:hypothetical protein